MKILLVDDDHSVRDVVRAMLTGMGCEVFSYDSKAQGVCGVLEAKACGARIDAVISDYELGDGFGTSVLEVAGDLFPDAVRVLMSGSADADPRASQHFLPKPFGSDELRRVLPTGKVSRTA